MQIPRAPSLPHMAYVIRMLSWSMSNTLIGLAQGADGQACCLHLQGLRKRMKQAVQNLQKIGDAVMSFVICTVGQRWQRKACAQALLRTVVSTMCRLASGISACLAGASGT